MLDASGNVLKVMRACRHLATDQAIDGGKQPLSLFDYSRRGEEPICRSDGKRKIEQRFVPQEPTL